MVMISCNVTEFRKLVNKGRLGIVAADGRTYDGRTITSLAFCRNGVVDYVMSDGKIGPKFQGVMWLDD